MALEVRQKLTRDQIAIIAGKEDGQPQRVRALEELITAINADPLEAIISPVSGDTTYTITSIQGNYSILIRTENLVASAGGPFILTITTGVGDVVQVPIAAFGDTILSPDLLFDVLVDSSGNVISKDWEVSGSNTNGTWVASMEGDLRQTAYLGASPVNINTVYAAIFIGLATWTLPKAFVNTQYSANLNVTGIGIAPWASTNPTKTTTAQTFYLFDAIARAAVALEYQLSAEGRWRA